MKIFQKTIFCILASLLIFSSLPVQAQGTARLKLDTGSGCYFGHTCAVAVKLETGGNNIDFVRVNLTFSTSVLQVEQITLGSIYTVVPDQINMHDNLNGTINIGAGVFYGNTKDTTIATIYFNVISGGEAQVNFSDATKVLSNGKDVYFTVSDQDIVLSETYVEIYGSEGPVNLRDQGTTEEGSNIIAYMYAGETYLLLEFSDGWYYIKYSDDLNGWVYREYARIVEEEEEAPPLSEGNTLAERLKGYILLQVERFGEAWYVNPFDLYRYYMPDGDSAYSLMRYHSLGISDADLAKIPTSDDEDVSGFDAELTERLKGYILLQVEQHGEAWYVNPFDSKRYYMPDGDAAYELMRYHSLGITDANLESIPVAED